MPDRPMPDRPTVDLDHHDPDFHAARHEHWAGLRRCPVTWNEHHGGFWMVSGHPEVDAVARDAEVFSSEHRPEPLEGIEYLGIAGIPRPPMIPTAGIAEAEGPIHVALRRLLNPHLVPNAVSDTLPLMADVARWFLDQRISTGAMDLVTEYTSPVPAIMTMHLVGLPLEDWSNYAEALHGTVAHRRGEPEFDRAVAKLPAILAQFDEEIAKRRTTPRADLLSELVAMEVDGRVLRDDEVRAVLWNLVGGGLDTTGSLASLSLLHLSRNPSQRHALIGDPGLMGTAIEEFLRYFSVNETLTRTVTRDVTLGGQGLRRGEHLMLSWVSANRDERVFERPDEMLLDRAPNPHLAFGVGPHRCIGMHMARTMTEVLLTEVLTRIPDYRVDEDSTRLYSGNPELNGVVSMPVTFTPSEPLGPAERPF